MGERCAFHHGAPGWLYFTARARAAAVEVAAFPLLRAGGAFLDRAACLALLRLAAATVALAFLPARFAVPALLDRADRRPLPRFPAGSPDLAFLPDFFATPPFLERVERLILLRFTIGTLRSTTGPIAPAGSRELYPSPRASARPAYPPLIVAGASSLGFSPRIVASAAKGPQIKASEGPPVGSVVERDVDRRRRQHAVRWVLAATAADVR